MTALARRYGRRTTRDASIALSITLALLLAFLVSASPAGAVGYQDFSYSAAGVSAPTRDKPQSKLWFNDGSWWGTFYNKFAARHEIYRLDRSTETWSTTGVALDSRPGSHADTLWDGTHLYVASISDTDVGKLYRLSYDSSTDTYSPDLGFPITLTGSGAETITIAKDSSGKIWSTFVIGQQVYVTHSTDSDATFVAPYVIPVPQASGIDADALSAIVAYPGKVGVMWGDQTDGRMHFASHADGAPDSEWTHSFVNDGPLNADDHLNLASLPDDPAGRIFSVYKTSRTAANDPLIVVAILGNDGVWRNYTVATAQYQHTRPIILVDTERRKLHVFMSAPCCGGGVIFHKETSLDSPSFSDGLGTPFVDLATDPKANNPTSTKQAITATTGMVVAAGDDSTKRYVHNSVDIAAVDRTPPETTILSSPGPSTASTTATFGFTASEGGSSFECRLDGGPFSPCTSPMTYTGLGVGSHSFAVRATDPAGNVDPTPATHTWTIDPSAATIVTPEADSYVDEALPGANRGSYAALRVDGGAGVRQDTYLRFRVDSLPSTVNEAKLRVYLTNGSGNGPAVYGAPNGWSESGITWANRPLPSTGALDDLGAVASNAFVEWDVSSLVTGPGTYTLVVSTSSTDGVVLNSREAGSNVPALVIKTGADTTPPETTINQAPPAATTLRAATFGFVANEPNSRFECSLDGAPFTVCSSPHEVSGLTVGSHAFEVRAIDVSGNLDPTPARHVWRVDEAPPPPPVTTKFSPTADTYVDEDHEKDNYGTKSELKAKLKIDDGDREERRTYIRFTPSGLSGTITSAKVRLWVKDGTKNATSIRGSATSWSETAVNWLTRPAVVGSVLETKATVAKDTYAEYDVTPHVAGNGEVSFALMVASDDEVKFSSREEGTTSKRPQLIVTTEPGLGIARARARRLRAQARRRCRLANRRRGARRDAWQRAAGRALCRSSARSRR